MASDVALSFQDETIQCCSCHNSFVWSARSQELHKHKGYQHKPKRCASCRQNRVKPAGNNNTRPYVKVERNTETRSDRDLILELCKAMGEMRVFLDRRFKELDQRLDQIDKDLFED